MADDDSPTGSVLDALAGPAPPGTLDVMTFNLKFASDREPNSWARRRPVLARLLAGERPHLVGTQEGLFAQLQDLVTDLGGDYGYLGLGRHGGSHGEFMAVFFDRRRLAPVAYDHFWLSGTPEVIGSNTWGGGSVRMVTWVRFADLATGAEFYAMNTHLDNASATARERAAILIRDRLAALRPRLPYVLTGDFNAAADPAGPVYATLTGGAGAVDTWTVARARSTGYGTCHNYRQPVVDGPRIDWILVSPGVSVPVAAMNTYQEQGQYPSDHLPVQARLAYG